MDVMSRQVGEIAMMSDQSLFVLHLNFKGVANDHRGLTRRMPVKRSHTTWSELGENDGRSLPRVALLNSDSKTFGSVEYSTIFCVDGQTDDWFFLRSLGNMHAGRKEETFALNLAGHTRVVRDQSHSTLGIARVVDRSNPPAEMKNQGRRAGNHKLSWISRPNSW